MAQALARRPCRAKAVSLSKAMDAQPRVEPPEQRHHDGHGLRGRLAGKPGGEDEPCLAFLEHQHRAGPPADQEVALPVPGFLALLDGLGPVVDGAPLGVASTPTTPSMLSYPAGPFSPPVEQLRCHRKLYHSLRRERRCCFLPVY